MLNDDEISPSLSVMPAKKQSTRSPVVVTQQDTQIQESTFNDDPFGAVNDQTFMPEDGSDTHNHTQIMTKSELQSLEQTTKA